MRNGGASKHTANTGPRGHKSQARYQWTILKVADPDRRQTFIVGAEGDQETSCHNGNVWRNRKISLEICETSEEAAAVARLAASPGRECLRQCSA